MNMLFINTLMVVAHVLAGLTAWAVVCAWGMTGYNAIVVTVLLTVAIATAGWYFAEKA